MNPDDTKTQIRDLLDLQAELTYYGGAEQAPTTWRDYATRRSLLFEHFGLPEITENFKLLDRTTLTGIERRRIYSAKLSDGKRLGKFTQLKDILVHAGISGFVDETTGDYRHEQIVNIIFDR